MGRLQAASLERRVHLDRQVEIQLWDGPPNERTGRATMAEARNLWAAIEDGGSEQVLSGGGADGTIVTFGYAVTVRWLQRFEGLTADQFRIVRGSATLQVTNVRHLGRRRFLRLEVV